MMSTSVGRGIKLGPRNCSPPSLTASVIGNSCRLADRRVATRASRESSGKGGDKAPPHRGDRVRDVAFGSDRWRLWVGNPREWQVARAAGGDGGLWGGGGGARGARNAQGGRRGWGGGGEPAPPPPPNLPRPGSLLCPDNNTPYAPPNL